LNDSIDVLRIANKSGSERQEGSDSGKDQQGVSHITPVIDTQAESNGDAPADDFKHGNSAMRRLIQVY
jgi:hypothetical protein